MLYGAYFSHAQRYKPRQTSTPRGNQACAYERWCLMPQYHGVMFRMAKGDSPFSAPMAEFITTDPAKFMAWVDRMESMGYVEAEEHDAHLAMLRAMSKKRQAELSKPYNPTPEQVAADRANRPSGKGQRPMPRPTRDYKGTQMPKGPWTPIREKW